MVGVGLISGIALVGVAVGSVRAGQQQKAAPVAMTPPQIAFFESKVRPVLINNCFACHANGQHSADIILDSTASLLKGNAHGPVLVPGDPDKSILLHVLNYDGKVKMPPAGKLRAEEIAALAAWVKMGAPWPDAGKKEEGKTTGGPPGGKPEKIVTAAQKQMWPFKTFRKPALPVVKNTAWAKTPIDRFILAGLEAKGLKPAAPAGRRDLLRRAYFDLIGLPPTPQEVTAFVADKSPDAFTRVVDRLLASPRYGERWGRHWLDVARYADSNGLDENIAFANAFRYRDYVINAFNKDKPYDQFIREQLAGDLLPASNDDERNEHLVATGFLSLGPKVLAEPDKPKMVMDIVDEQIEVTSKAFLGLTVACARCHDHKFDPIPTKDYYALAGIFKSTRTMESLNTVARCYERPLVSSAAKAQMDAQKQKVKELEQGLKRETDSANQTLLADQRANLAKYLLAGWELAQQPGAESLAELPTHANDVRLFVEAEKFNRGNAHIDTETYGKGIGVIHTVAVPTFAEWDITLPKAGAYQLELRYAAVESRPIRLIVNGQAVKEDAAAHTTGSWNPDGQKWEAQGVYAFAAGKNTVRIERNGDIPHIDKLMIVPVSTGGAGAKVRPVEQIAAEYKLNPALVRLWAARLRVAQNDPIMGAFARYAHIPAERFAQQAPTVGAQLASANALPAVVNAFAGFTGSGLDQVAVTYQELFNRSQDAKSGELAALRATLTEKNGLLAVPTKPETLYDKAVAKNIADMMKAVQMAKASVSEAPLAMAVEEGKIENCRVHLRGDTQTLGDEVPRHFLTIVADGDKATIDPTHSGRLELAQWLTRPDHPLTGRVEVNRIWQEHFGAGLSRTPENFGLLGERPSHPELLDWLAATFVEKGWSIKQVHRLIMLSNTYQTSTTQDPKAALEDADNRLLSHFNRRRLEAEPFRDSLLYVAGKLDPSLGGSLLGTPDNGYVTNDQSGNGANYAAPRRSVYLPIIRNALFDMFQAFDVGDPSIVNAHRSTTTVAPQALYMMNSPFVMEQAKAFAEELQKSGKTDADRINDAYLRAFGRAATPTEIARSIAFLTRYQTALARTVADAPKRQQIAWQSLCQVILASNEFIYVN
jgi:Protein of unknown function (DUF1549)/Protein of unknown function (DUF1553)/Planctomycete cytochrome C